METVSPHRRDYQVPERFKASRSTVLVDRFMTGFINIGGISIITIVLGIFIFILWQVLPLFQGAQVHEQRQVPLGDISCQLLGLDEYSELPLIVDDLGNTFFYDVMGDDGLQEADPGFPESKTITAVFYHQKRQDLVFASDDGHFSLAKVEYEAVYEGDDRRITGAVSAGDWLPIGREGQAIRTIRYGDGGDRKLVAVLQEVEGQMELHVVRLVQESTLFGEGDVTVDRSFDLTSFIEGTPRHLLVDRTGQSIYLSTMEGNIQYLSLDDDGSFKRLQSIQPFEDRQEESIESMDFLFGDNTLVLTNPEGENRLYSLSLNPETGERRLVWTKSFESLGTGATFYAQSQRNKAFLIGHDTYASLRYGTTETLRWETTLPFQVEHSLISEKYDRILLLDDSNVLHFYELNDPHPEAGFKAMFGKVWYEGNAEASYTWQSTGGSDEFEPKLSLIPLIFGTMKGTFYAMIFAMPIALMAALYTSQFSHYRIKAFVKPTMEIMASLPSVVLGFLAALWLAPLVETRVPSILLMCVAIPLISMIIGWGWSALPIQYRVWIRPGFEFLVFVPVFLACVVACWHLGPFVERIFFVAADPSTGQRIVDFRYWWPEVVGADFDQRNSMVVGFAMGFAVIPLIFTITEDALSNVPETLRSASLALGASRWQTAFKVVLPTASAGIFSALMIGLGRAVGETMILVMATGNTPIMEMNIFSGMRTLAANIAVELPEAPQHGTLYRTLFLGAMVLFLMTFFVNTIAEILRHRLREKYKLV